MSNLGLLVHNECKVTKSFEDNNSFDFEGLFNGSFKESSLLPGVTKEVAFQRWKAQMVESSVQTGRVGKFDYGDTHGHGIHSSVTRDGTLSFTIRTDKGNKKRIERGSLFGKSEETGTDLFDRMMAFHRGQVKRIEAEWTDANPNLQDNFDSYMKSLSARMSPFEAASNTFTGRLAARHGYNKITIEKVITDRDGFDHHYIVFEK